MWWRAASTQMTCALHVLCVPQDKPDEAIQLYNKAIAILSKKDEKSKEVAALLNNIGGIKESQVQHSYA